MGRKTVVILLIGLTFGSVRFGEAQPTKTYRIGVLSNASGPEVLSLWNAFRQGLRDHAWVEGKNVVIEYRWAEGRVERFPALAAELVSLTPDVIVAVSTLGARAAKQATSAIPIVMVYVGDPVEE